MWLASRKCGEWETTAKTAFELSTKAKWWQSKEREKGERGQGLFGLSGRRGGEKKVEKIPQRRCCTGVTK